MLSVAMDKFIGLLSDQSKLVVESASSAFVKFNEFYPGVFLRNVNY